MSGIHKWRIPSDKQSSSFACCHCGLMKFFFLLLFCFLFFFCDIKYHLRNQPGNAMNNFFFLAMDLNFQWILSTVVQDSYILQWPYLETQRLYFIIYLLESDVIMIYSISIQFDLVTKVTRVAKILILKAQCKLHIRLNNSLIINESEL